MSMSLNKLIKKEIEKKASELKKGGFMGDIGYMAHLDNNRLHGRGRDKKKLHAGRLLVDDLDNAVIGGAKKEVKKKRGDGGASLAVFRKKVDTLRKKHPNLSYREAQKMVANK